MLQDTIICDASSVEEQEMDNVNSNRHSSLLSEASRQQYTWIYKAVVLILKLII